LSEQRWYRKFTAKERLEIVVASLRGDRTVAELCREHGIAESLLSKWRESWFGKLKEQEVWLNEETLDDDETRHRRLRRPLPPPPAQQAELPDARRGAPNLEDQPQRRKQAD
jgi:transposase